MPNTHSAKKRMRQDEVRRVRNRAVKSTIKTQVRKVREAVTAGKLDEADTEYRLMAKRVDKAAAHGVIHANAAGRMKSRISAALHKAKQR